MNRLSRFSVNHEFTMTFQPFARLRSATGQTYILNESLMRLGREPENDIILPSDKASRYHAQIRFVEGRYFIEDLNSKNGIRINGELINNGEEQKLAIGDTLRIGGLDFYFEQLQTNETITEIRPKPVYLTIDKGAWQVILEGKILNPPLTPFQWKLLVFLYENRGKVCSRDQIIDEIWNPQLSNEIPSDSAIETHISKLRDRLKLNKNSQAPYLETIRTVGYKLVL